MVLEISFGRFKVQISGILVSSLHRVLQRNGELNSYGHIVSGVIVLGLMGHQVCCKGKKITLIERSRLDGQPKESTFLLKAFLAWMAASAAISSWDYGAFLGLSAHSRTEMSARNQKFYSAWLTGVFEGLTQGLLTEGLEALIIKFVNSKTWVSRDISHSASFYLGKLFSCLCFSDQQDLSDRLLSSNELDRPFFHCPSLDDLWSGLVKLIKSVTLGGLSGSLWQIVFVACIMPSDGKQLHPVVTAICVCMVCFIMNGIYAVNGFPRLARGVSRAFSPQSSERASGSGNLNVDTGYDVGNQRPDGYV